MNESMAEILRFAENLPKFMGWEVRRVSESAYRPDRHWEPFAVTNSSWGVSSQNTIWSRRQKMSNET
uniref:Uncharacterized protein n=1 Tax=viral metagenome TaxID=1070528 RepID=A0A6M3JMW8_9ZZZZ